MYVPLVDSPKDVRLFFGRTTDAVVVPVYDLPTFDDEGEERDPVDGCRVFVRISRVVELIRSATGWECDSPPVLDLGYAPAATFTLSADADGIRDVLEEHLCNVPIYRRGEWVNTFA